MNTLYPKLLILLYGLALTTGAGLLAAESPAPGGLAEDAPSTRSVSSPPVDPGATAGPQTSPKTPNSSSGAAQAIPILLVVFGCPVAIVGLVAYFRARKQKQLHETLRAMIEKGVPIPPGLLRSPAPTGDASEADRAWKHLASFRGRARFSTWLFAIAVNEFRSAARRRKELLLEDLDSVPSEAEPSSDNQPTHAQLDLNEALLRLTASERAAIVLCCQNGLSHDEAGRVLGCPLGTVKTHVLRGKEKLRRWLAG